MSGSNDTKQRQRGFVNLPNDVARCAGWLSTGEMATCPHRHECKRYEQLAEDRKNPPERYPMISNCLVNGEYTMRIEAK